jgi:hypothetical protein
MIDSESCFSYWTPQSLNVFKVLTPSACSSAQTSEGQFALRPSFDKTYYEEHAYLIVFAVPVFNKFVWYISQIIPFMCNQKVAAVHETLCTHAFI